MLNRALAGAQEAATYTLFNPSVADYVLAKLAQSDLWEYYYRSMRTMGALSQLQQMRAHKFFGEAKYRSVLKATANSEARKPFRYDQYSLRLARLLTTEPSLSAEARKAIESWMVRSVEESELDPSDYLTLFSCAGGIVGQDTLLARAEELPAYLENTYVPLEHAHIVGRVLEQLNCLGASKAHKKVRSSALASWKENIAEAVKQADVLSSYIDDEDTSDAERQLESFVVDQLAETGINLTSGETDQLCSQVDIYEAIEHNRRVAAAENRESALRPRDEPDGSFGDIAAVDDLFERA